MSVHRDWSSPKNVAVAGLPRFQLIRPVGDCPVGDCPVGDCPVG